MGSSKVILTGAISLIVGIYSLGIKNADKNAFAPTIKRGQIIQMQQIARSGVQLIIDDLSYYDQNWYLPASSRTLRGDSLYYQPLYFTGDSATYRINVTSRTDRSQYLATAKFIRVNDAYWWWTRDRWRLDRLYGYTQSTGF